MTSMREAQDITRSFVMGFGGMMVIEALVRNAESFTAFADAVRTMIDGRCPKCGYLFTKRAYGCDYEFHVKYPERASRHGC